MKTKICIGTAQFGMNYGITNKYGKTRDSEVRAILEEANRKEISYLDTAKVYGDAEKVIGKCKPKNSQLKIITKITKARNQTITIDDERRWQKELDETLKDIGEPEVDTILIHNADDLKKEGKEILLNWLKYNRDRGITREIGASIYDKEDAEELKKHKLDAVQLPVSLYDQRLIKNETIKRLKDDGLTVHARSIYLQGLLLVPSTEWPTWISSEKMNHHRRLIELAIKKNCRLIDLAIGFAKKQEEIDIVTIGVSTQRELRELNDAWSNDNMWEGEDWSKWDIGDEVIQDPRKWPR